MRCSQCSNIVRPIVAIDIDGTLGDYHSHFLEFAHRYLGSQQTYAEYDGGERYSKWFMQAFGVDLRTFRDVKLAYRQGGMKRFMPVFPGARGFVACVRSAGSEVWLTTTRPYLRVDNIDPDTREWLRRNEFVYDGLLYDEDKYQALAERVDPGRVVGVVEDDPYEYNKAADVFGSGVPILMASINSIAVDVPNTVSEYDQARVWLEQRIDYWREEA